MGTITSGVGLISGLNIDDIVSKLMAIEKQPITNLQARIKDVDAQKTAITDLSARVLALKATFAPLKSSLLFKSTKATSSNQDILQASASSGAAAGTHRIRVQQLAAAQQLVTRGFADPARSPLGSGTVVVASALSKLAQQTSLDMLNGQTGVSSGSIRITDGSGSSAQVDLSSVKSVQDVISAINTASGIQVRAEVRGDKLALVDLSGSTAASLSVADVGTGHTARDLGLLGIAVTTGSNGQRELVGTDVNTITENTSLSLLNDGNGVGNAGGGGDLAITGADGKTINVNLSDYMDGSTNLAMLNNGAGVRLGKIKITHADGTINEVDLTTAKTIGDVTTLLKSQGNLSAVAGGNKLLVTDTVKGIGKLTIENGTGSFTASDLGITGQSIGSSDASVTQSITGSEVYRIRTVGDVLRAINYASGNTGATGGITATLDAAGKGIRLTGTGPFTVTSLTGSTAAADLGLTGTASGDTLTGTRLIATMNTTMLRSLNGGQGIHQLGQITVTDRANQTSTYDFTGAKTIDDVLAILNQAPAAGGAQIHAQLADSGLGLVLQDTSTGGTGTLTVADVTGTTAQDLKIAGSTTGASLTGGKLYRQFVSGSTQLSDLNFGKGVAAGSFSITDSAGRTATFSVNSSITPRLQDLVSQINRSADGSSTTATDGTVTTNAHVEARINDTGDGIVIIDKAGGANSLRIADNGSTTAADLKIAGTAAVGQDRLDGRISQEIVVGGGDSLNSFVSQLGKASDLLSVGIINDGSDVSPYRLMISAQNSGTRGALAIDTGGVDLGLDTLVQAQDAIAYIGGDGVTGGIRVVSSENQLTDVIPNVTLTLAGKVGGYSDVTVAEDTETLTKQFSSIADKIGDVVKRIGDLTSYDATANTRGILLGDSSVYQLSDTMYSLIGQRVTVNGLSLSLSDLGFSITSTGASFDQDKFQQKFDANPDAVMKAFTDSTDGLWAKLDKVMTSLSDSSTGLLPSRSQSLQDQEDLFNKRVDDLNTLLTSKQNRLYAQYQAMESALSQLQGQQAALASLVSLTPSTSTKTSSSK